MLIVINAKHAAAPTLETDLEPATNQYVSREWQAPIIPYHVHHRLSLRTGIVIANPFALQVLTRSGPGTERQCAAQTQSPDISPTPETANTQVAGRRRVWDIKV